MQEKASSDSAVAVWQGNTEATASPIVREYTKDDYVGDENALKNGVWVMQDKGKRGEFDNNGKESESGAGWLSRNKKVLIVVVFVVVVAAIAGGIGAAVAGSGSEGNKEKDDEVKHVTEAKCLHELGEEFRELVDSGVASLENWPEMQYELRVLDFCTNYGFFSPLCQSDELLRSRGLTYDEGSWRFEDEALLEYSYDDNGQIVAELTIRLSHDPLRDGRLVHIRSVVDLEAGCIVDFLRSEIVLPSLAGTRTFLDGNNPNVTTEETRPAERHRCSDEMSGDRRDAANTLIWYFESHPLSLVLLLEGTWILNLPTRAGHHTIEVGNATIPKEPCVPSTQNHICGPNKNGVLGFAMLSGPLLEIDPLSNGLASAKNGAGDPLCSKQAWTSPLEIRENVVAPEGVKDVTTPDQRACIDACIDDALVENTVQALGSMGLDACSAACLPDGPSVELANTNDGVQRQMQTSRKVLTTTTPVEEKSKPSFPIRRRLDQVLGLREEENDPAPICTKKTAGIAFEDIHEWATVPPKALENLFQPECSDLDFANAVSKVVNFVGTIPYYENSTNRFSEVAKAFEDGRASLSKLLEGITDVEHLTGWTHNLLVQPLVFKCFTGPIRSDLWDLRVSSELLALLPYVGPFFEQVANVLRKLEDITDVFLEEFLDTLTVDQDVFKEFINTLTTLEEIRSNFQHISYRVETVLEPALYNLSRIDGYSEVFDPVSMRIKTLVEGIFYPLGPTLEGIGNLGIVIVSELSSAFALDNIRSTVCRLRDFFSQFRRFWEEFTSSIGLSLLQNILDYKINLRDVLFGGPVIGAAKSMCGGEVFREAFCAPVCRVIPGPIKEAAAEAKRVWNKAVDGHENAKECVKKGITGVVKCAKDEVERIGGNIGNIFRFRRRLDDACEGECADICSCAAGIGIGNAVGGPVGIVGGAVEADCLGGFVKRAMNEINITFTIRQVLEQVDRVKQVIDEAKELSDGVVQDFIEASVMDLVESLVPDFDIFISAVPNLQNGKSFAFDKLGELLNKLLGLPEEILCLVADNPFSCPLLGNLSEVLNRPLTTQNTSPYTNKPTAGPTLSPSSSPSSAPSIICVDSRRRQLRSTSHDVSSNPFCSYDFPYKLRITPMRRQKCRSDRVCWYPLPNSTGGFGSGGLGSEESGKVNGLEGSIPKALDGAWVELDGNVITTTNLVFDAEGIPVSGTMTVMMFNQNGYVLGTSRTNTQESSESVAALAAYAGGGLVAFPSSTNSDNQEVVLFDIATSSESVVSSNNSNLKDFGKAVALYEDANNLILVTVSRETMGDSQSHTFNLKLVGGGKWMATEVSVDALPDGLTTTILGSLGVELKGMPEFFYLSRLRVDADMMGYVAPASAAPLPNPSPVDPTNFAPPVSMGRIVLKPLPGGEWIHLEPKHGDDGCSALSLSPNLVAAACGWYFSRRIYVIPKESGGSLGAPEILEPPGYVGKVTISTDDLFTPDGIKKMNTLLFTSLAEWTLAVALSPDERTLVLSYPMRILNFQEILDSPGVEVPFQLGSHLHVFCREKGASWSYAIGLKSSDFSLPLGVLPEEVYFGIDLAFADDSDTVFVTGVVNDSSFTQFIRSFRVSSLSV